MIDNRSHEAAKQLWQAIPGVSKTKILNSVWCSQCSKKTTIVDYTGTIIKGDLLLEGACLRCRNKVARLIEIE